MEQPPSIEPEKPLQPETLEKPSESSEQRTERLTGRMDQAFEDLIDIAAQSPEANRAAIQALVSHIQQTSEQLSQVRDVKHLQELKRLMLENWKELQELTGGDVTLLKRIQEWGKKFIEQKVIGMQAIEDVKDEMADKAHDIQGAWNSVQAELGLAAGLIGGEHDLDAFWRQWDYQDFGQIHRGEIRKGPGLDRFLESMTSLESGFSRGDIDVKTATAFLEKANQLISGLYARAAQRSQAFGAQEKEAATTAIQRLDAVMKKMDTVSENVREASKIFKVVKRLNDTTFLPLFNEMPEAA